MRAALGGMATGHLAGPATDLVPMVLGAMHVQAITWWLEQGRPVPAREIAERTARLTRTVPTDARSD